MHVQRNTWESMPTRINDLVRPPEAHAK